MRLKLEQAIQRRLEEIGKDNESAKVRKHLTDSLEDIMLGDDNLDDIINTISNQVVSDYARNLKTVTVTLEVEEDKLRAKWEDEFPNISLENILMEELSWVVDSTIAVKEVKENVNNLELALETEVRQAMYSIEKPLSPNQITDIVNKLLNKDSVWYALDEEILKLVTEAR